MTQTNNPTPETNPGIHALIGRCHDTPAAMIVRQDDDLAVTGYALWHARIVMTEIVASGQGRHDLVCIAPA